MSHECRITGVFWNTVLLSYWVSQFRQFRVNAILNYLYGLLHWESPLAAYAVGLDLALRVLHLDIAANDSLARHLRHGSGVILSRRRFV